jgi:glucose/arabinose dehydrogenase
MYISIGSTCNVCNETPKIGGSLWISNSEGIKPQIFATGLRNAPFLTINPVTKELWATEMGRDFLGDNLPPDEINIIKKDKNYGWPLCYGNKIHDTNFDKKASNPCINTEPPLFEIPAHSAPLGIVFVDSSQFPSDWQGDLLVAYHGSWNRSTASGYKVVHMKVRGNSIVSAEDFLTGFLEGTDKDLSKARPVDLLFDKQGNLYISDDKGGNIFIIQKN